MLTTDDLRKRRRHHHSTVRRALLHCKVCVGYHYNCFEKKKKKHILLSSSRPSSSSSKRLQVAAALLTAMTSPACVRCGGHSFLTATHYSCVRRRVPEIRVDLAGAVRSSLDELFRRIRLGRLGLYILLYVDFTTDTTHTRNELIFEMIILLLFCFDVIAYTRYQRARLSCRTEL
ncbi:hypothetical protein AGLY_010987 [Aphis glycines]|uniref:Uncharacterized protein n=1 Tax=Aphis glycines TaxID=307491 RepID=A0A6G0TD30_APHGL|nr:hypothetical protein AGLY_010987 [Aphis glycines]